MKSPTKTKTTPRDLSRLTLPLAVALIGVGLLLYFMLGLDARLMAQAQQPVFLCDSTWMGTFLQYPGGLSELLGEFLGQVGAQSWYGSGVLLALLASVWALTWLWLKKEAPSKANAFWAGLPLILLVALHNNYHRPFSTTLDLMVSLLALVIYQRTAPARPWLRGLWFGMLLALVYYVTAAHAVLFAVLVILDEILMKRWALAAVDTLVTVTLPYAAVSILFVIPVHQAYTRHLTHVGLYPASWQSWALLATFPLLWLWSHVVRARLPERLRRESSLYQIVQALVLIALIGAATRLSINRKAKVFFLIDYQAQHHQWQELLQTASQGFPHHNLIQCHLNRALYHTDQLLDNMFRWPQAFGSEGLFVSPSLHGLYPGQHADVFADLGLVNEAQHWGYEAIVVYGETPANLQRLAVAHALKDDPMIAGRYARRLGQTLWQRDWARQFQAALDDPNANPDFADLATIRSYMPTEGFLLAPSHPQMCLAPLVEQSSHRMVYEYTLAYHLLAGHLKEFAALLPRLSEFGYPSLPRHVEEALLVLRQMTSKSLTLPGYTISEPTRARFDQFNQIMRRHNRNKVAAQKDLQPLRDTYWYYAFYQYQPKPESTP